MSTNFDVAHLPAEVAISAITLAELAAGKTEQRFRPVVR
jgi:hypothetical protein